MPTVKEIKEELEFNESLSELLEQMKNIAVFKFRSLQRRKERFKICTQALEGFFRLIDSEGASHPFLRPAAENTAILMITSDEGLMGGLSANVVNTVVTLDKTNEAELIVVGERGTHYLKEMGRRFVLFKGVEFEERYNLAVLLKDHIIRGVKEKRFGRVVISYPRPISFMLQRVDVINLLPISTVFKSKEGDSGKMPLIIESPIEDIIEFLVDKFVVQSIVEVLEDSKLSEFAARALHLEKSGQELIEKKKGISFDYLRARHNLVDKNIRELFSSQIIRKKNLP